jgi:tryptophan halogenase
MNNAMNNAMNNVTNNAKPNLIKKITIVGGGSAGWMTAAGLANMLPAGDVEITLIESEQIGTVGVGEATIPNITFFNRMLGIDEREFIKATDATFKLGIEFVDWGQLGDTYFHPFGGHGVDMNGIDFHQYWLHSLNAGNPSPIEDYSLCAVAAKHNKFTLPDQNPQSILSNLSYAYHFDATAYAKFLRNYAEKRGVKRVEGKITKVNQHQPSGDIASVELADGSVIDGDFFFDCSGFRSLLLGQTLEVGFRDWRHWLPCNTAQTVATEQTASTLPYTRSTAKESGWQWRIPTQNRVGNGHIYCDEYTSSDDAQKILLAGLDGKPISDIRTIKFKTGCHEVFWQNNCIGIGLSAGFLEPLESTSIFLIQQGISRFIALYPNGDLPDIVRDEYNRLMTREFEQVRDFIILHYKATQRDDSSFWRYVRDMPIPDSLTHKMALFKQAGRIFRDDNELFTRASWVAVMLGQNLYPKTHEPILANIPMEQIQRSLASMKNAMTQAATQLPEHAAFINKYTAHKSGPRF